MLRILAAGMVRMGCIALVGAAVAVAAPAAGAQATVNYGTRTATAASSGSVPSVPGQVENASATLQGSLDTHALAPSDLGHVVYRFQFSVASSAGGITDPTAGFVMSQASIWMNGHVDDTKLVVSFSPNDFRVYEDGYGDEFSQWRNAQGAYDLPFSFVGSGYSVLVEAATPLSGQGTGAYGSASATATLVGAYLLNDDGSIRQQASFDGQGNGTFAATTPEPGALVLLGTGLVGLVPAARRRRLL